MAHPIYRVRGERVPSVTTVLSRFKESGGLIRWAYKLGQDGKDMDAERDNAAHAGHLAHAMIEAYIRGQDPQAVSGDEANLALARKGFEGFMSWVGQTKLELVETEVSMVSEQHAFGGTLDALANFDGGLALLDWKCSNRVYSDYLCQLAAYKLLWEENNFDRPIKSVHLLRLGKDFGDFTHHHFPAEAVAIGESAFLMMRKLYSMDGQLKKAVGQ